MKTLTYINANNEIVSIVETNEKSFIPNKALNIVDITDHPQKEEIIDNQSYFKVSGKKIVEKTKAQKDIVDAEREKIFHPQNQDDPVKALQDKVTSLETEVKKLKDAQVVDPVKNTTVQKTKP